jgi:serine/threonine protein kinase/tetratricopeptide (TPR) repeat protein
MIGQTISHYTITEKLGSGGMGEVYKAHDNRLRRSVALKFLSDELSRDPKAVERFEREATAASGLNHPHICVVHDIGEHGGRCFIVMELLNGKPLSDKIGGRQLASDTVLDLALQIADALGAAHARGIVHRDIKPGNIFVTEHGQAKLLDFGLAKTAVTSQSSGEPGFENAQTTQARLTVPGTVMGTVAYMSPEQVRGEPLDARSDLFSFGAVLFEMVTGRLAFPGATSGVMQEAILNRPPAWDGAVPGSVRALDEVIRKALEKDRALRYQSAADLRADLQRVKRDADSARFGVAGSPAKVDGKRRTPGVVAGATALALILLTAAAWSVWSRSSRDAIESIAVLPFDNGSGDPNAEYLSDGLTESVINNLSQVPSLRVAARSAVFRYKGRGSDPQRAGQDLRVRTVLSGRLLVRGDTLVVRTDLMDVSNGSQLWGQEYSRKLTDVIALQEDLSREISQRLRLRLTTEEEQKVTKRYTDNPEAYQLYLQGRYYWHKRSAEGQQKANDYLLQAIERDPSYALAYVGLADVYNLSSFFNVAPPRAIMPKAKAAAMRALEIDEQLADAHVALGYASFTYDWDWTAAVEHFDRALALNRSAVLNHSQYPFYLTVGKRADEAIAVARLAAQQDPVSASLSHTLAVQLALAGKPDLAIEECRKTVDLDPNFAVGYEVMGASFAAKGMYGEALPQMEKAVALGPGNVVSRAELGFVRARLGQRKEALQILDDLAAASKTRYVPAQAFATVYVGLRDNDRAFEWLEKAYEERVNRLAYLRVEPTWNDIRSDPRFQALLKKIGLPQ